MKSLGTKGSLFKLTILGDRKNRVAFLYTRKPRMERSGMRGGGHFITNF